MSDSLWPYGLQHGSLPYLLKFSQTHAHCVEDDTLPPPPLPSPPAFNLSQHQGLFQCQPFTSGGQSIGASASASLLPVNIPDWFSFRMDWLDLLAVQGILKSLLQHHNSKASILLCSAFFMVQFSRLYMITGKTIALTICNFVSKLMSAF